MLYEVLRYIRNFFVTEYREGTYNIENGTITLPFKYQYVLIEGSAFNDGVHKYPLENLKEEEFTGSISAVNPPADFLALVAEIEAYIAKNEATGYASESFGGYSYTKATVNGKLAGWQDVFRDRLKVWCKI